MLVDGLKILISKEDELLYAASVQTLDLPDMYERVLLPSFTSTPTIFKGFSLPFSTIL